MKFEIKVTGPRACGKTRAVEGMLNQLENYRVVDVLEVGETEIWTVEVNHEI